MYKYASLPPHTLNIIQHKHTEPPFSGKYQKAVKQGSYLCRGCGAVLFRANNQFTSTCGWPSFDDEIKNAVKQETDHDGMRTEILCRQCNAHLGHIFTGEQLTPKNQRYCVNAISIEFVPDSQVKKTEEIIVGGGCFWGVQHLFAQLPGVLLTEVGYIDGITDYPTYQHVCTHNTHHVEAVRIVFDSDKLSYENAVKYFMEIHDPTQMNGQGPDMGSQYVSRIFYFDDAQKNAANHVIKMLTDKGDAIATLVKPVTVFWAAEEEHQDYYQKHQSAPYCHRYTKRF